MDFEVKVIEDSISPAGKRLATITATYPRFIHAELLMHRAFARNAASSRAIPWAKMKANIEASPVIPMAWGAEKSGMQTGEQIPEHMHAFAEKIWGAACKSALRYADALANIGREFADTHPDLAQPGDENVRIHKSIPNRITEPWMWITTVISATEWKNFYRLRCHPDAEVHFQKIACMIRDALAASKPVERRHHLPFIQPDEREDDNDRHAALPTVLAKISTARCARVSYLTHEGVRSPAADLSLFDKLSNGSGIGHFSPFEHVATASDSPTERSGPFVGWKQYRKNFENENLPG